MGIAAYNRGTAVLSRQIDAELPTLNELFLADLNACSAGAKDRIFQGTVVRFDGKGEFWLMNRQDKGWASYGRRYRSLREIADQWAVIFVSAGRDEHSYCIQVEPRPTN